MNTFIY